MMSVEELCFKLNVMNNAFSYFTGSNNSKPFRKYAIINKIFRSYYIETLKVYRLACYHVCEIIPFRNNFLFFPI